MWTWILFGLITVAFVMRHLRAHSGGAKAAPTCASCDAAVPAGASRCPNCGVPSQIFEVVDADEAGEEEIDTGAVHAIVRSDVCVGCGACVPPCPIPGAIRMEGKVAVVDINLCDGHAKCAEACPVGALHIGSGSSQRIEVPNVGSDFQTNVPGIYVVGELGGRGLIKNAVNEGKVAGEGVARSLVGAEELEGHHDVIIVGSGPSGLSAALECKKRGLSYLVLEQGAFADTINKYPRHKLLLAEPVAIPLYGDLWVADASKENLLMAWQAIIDKTGLKITTHHRVEAIEGDLTTGFAVMSNGCEYRTRRIILALGRRGTPRKLGVAGEDLSKVLYDIVEMEAFAGRKIVVVGGGDSALESAIGLANQAQTEVILSYRGDNFPRAKARNVQKLEAAAAEGRLQIWYESHVRAVRNGEIDIERNDEMHTIANDNLVVRIGGSAPYDFLKTLGIQIVRKEVPLVGAESNA